MAEEEASFSTEMLAMSLALIIDKSSTGMPSTTMSGEEFWLFDNVPKPRMEIDDVAVTSPLFDNTVKPGTAPCRALVTSCSGREPNVFSMSTFATAPVRLAFFCWP